MVAHTCNPNTSEVEAWVQGQPRLYSESEAKDGYMKLCFKNPKDGGLVKEPKNTSQGGWWLENQNLQDGMTIAVRTSQAKVGYQIHCWQEEWVKAQLINWWALPWKTNWKERPFIKTLMWYFPLYALDL